MYEIKDDVKYTLEIKNSKFISLLIRVNYVGNVDSLIKDIKNNYPKANHYCFAYVIDGVNKSSDDGEPSGTAGVPILNILQKNKLNNILCVVVRYFGGIKLGTGGLTRAYSKCARYLVDSAIFQEMENGYLVRLSFNYNEEQNISYMLRNCEVIKKEYLEVVTYYVLVNFVFYEKLKDLNLDVCIIKELEIRKI